MGGLQKQIFSLMGLQGFTEANIPFKGTPGVYRIK